MDNLITGKTGRRFFKYVLQNVLGMIGMSAYMLADVFFISLDILVRVIRESRGSSFYTQSFSPV